MNWKKLCIFLNYIIFYKSYKSLNMGKLLNKKVLLHIIKKYCNREPFEQI